MAWSESDISSAQNLWQDDDKPWIIPENLFTKQGNAYGWKNSAGTDVTDSDYPEVRVGDGYTDLLTQTSSAADSVYYFEVTRSTNVSFDTFAIVRHGNLSGVTVSVQVADDSGFSTNLTTIDTMTPGAGRKVLHLESPTTGNRARISSQYFRILFNKGAAFNPQMYEMFLGRRRQLKHNPFVPWDPDAEVSDAVTVTSFSGKQTTYVRNKRRAVFSGEIVTGGDSDREADILAIWEESQGGTKPVIFCPKPNSAPDLFYLCHLQKEFSYPYNGPNERRWSFTLTEQGPDYLSTE